MNSRSVHSHPPFSAVIIAKIKSTSTPSSTSTPAPRLRLRPPLVYVYARPASSIHKAKGPPHGSRFDARGTSPFTCAPHTQGALVGHGIEWRRLWRAIQRELELCPLPPRALLAGDALAASTKQRGRRTALASMPVGPHRSLARHTRRAPSSRARHRVAPLVASHPTRA